MQKARSFPPLGFPQSLPLYHLFLLQNSSSSGVYCMEFSLPHLPATVLGFFFIIIICLHTYLSVALTFKHKCLQTFFFFFFQYKLLGSNQLTDQILHFPVYKGRKQEKRNTGICSSCLTGSHHLCSLQAKRGKLYNFIADAYSISQHQYLPSKRDKTHTDYSCFSSNCKKQHIDLQNSTSAMTESWGFSEHLY